MRRSFLPIGQGAFYWEQFDYKSESGDRINVIYDCGSLSGSNLLYKQITNCFTYGEKIHAVFLSHFDEDHVNGLEHLLRYTQVQHIFFPLLTNEDKILIRLQYLVNSASADEQAFNEQAFWLRFALEPYETIRQMDLGYTLTLHLVSSENQNEENVDFDDNSLERDSQQRSERDSQQGSERDSQQRSERDSQQGLGKDSKKVRVNMVSSGENIFEKVCNSVTSAHSIHKANWLYIPFHFREKERRNQLKVNLKKSLGTSDPEELLDRLKSNPSYRKDIKKAYGKIPGGFNTNSMTLFSGTKSERSAQLLIYYQCLRKRWCFPYKSPCTKCRFSIKPGILYMGDYDTSGSQKWQQLQEAYTEYIPYIGCLQVPHHGSKHSFNSKLLDIVSCQVYLISAGLKNRYKHPSGDIVKQIMLSGKYLGIVTEDFWSEITMDVFF